MDCLPILILNTNAAIEASNLKTLKKARPRHFDPRGRACKKADD